MTVSSETLRRSEYNGSGSAGPFNIGFTITDDDNITVIHTSTTGTFTNYVKTTDYTVSAALDTITLVVALASGEKLTILGNTPLTQEIEYIDFTKLPAENTELGLDKLTNIVNEIQEGLGRCITLAAGSRSEDIVFPDPVANYYIKWNSGATALENVSGLVLTDADYGDITVSSTGTVFTIDSNVISAYGRTLVDDANAAGARVTLGLGNIATQDKSAIDITGGTIVGITDISIADGGTGSSTAVGARAALGLEIGVNVQAYSAALSAVSGTNTGDQTITLTGDVTGSGTGSFAATIANDAVTYAKMQNVSATDKLLGRSTAGAGDVEEITCTSFGRSLLDDTTASDARTTLGLVIGTNVQAYDAQLADVAGLTPTDNGVIIGNSTNFVVESGATLKASLGLTIGTDVQAYSAALDAVSGTNTGDQNIFGTISVSGQSDVVADSTSDTLTLVAGTNITITTAAGTDSITINSTAVSVSDGDKGDITVSASGATWTIDAGVVTLAKMADMATDSFLGRDTAGTGAPEVLSVATVKTLLSLTGTNSGDQTITLTGDVTGSGTGSFAATIANDAVTYAKMQDVSATDKILGRSTAGAGVIEEIACTAAGRAILDDADASAQRTTLGLGTLSTQNGTFVDWTAASANFNTTGTLASGSQTVTGVIDLTHTATENDDHAIEIICNAAAYGDVKAIDIVHNLGAVAAGEEESTISINIDETATTGGAVFALEVLSTDVGAITVYGMHTGVGVNPINQASGTLGNADSVDDNGADVTAALASGGAGNVAAFTNDNETLTIGDAAEFYEIEVILDTAASGSGIAPTFEYSTGVGTWASFSPVDGTNGMRNSGEIAWLNGDIPSWAVGTGSNYLIRITRTRNTLATAPIIDLIQVAPTTEFSWDKSGNLIVNSIVPTVDLAVAYGGTGASTAADARTNLGLVIGTNVQAYDAQLADIAGLTPTDNGVIIGNGVNFVVETSGTLLTSIGLGTGDSPQFTAVNIGHASDTTIARSGAGDITVEGNLVYRAGGTDIPVTDGGTGASTAADARTNLGLAIGTDVQAYSADLTDLITQWTPASAASAASLVFLEDTDNGSHSVTISAPASLAASQTLTLPDATGTVALTSDITGTNSGTNTGDQSIFQTIAVSGQSNVVADTTTDTLTLVAGTNITITTDAATDSITITSAGGDPNYGVIRCINLGYY